MPEEAIDHKQYTQIRRFQWLTLLTIFAVATVFSTQLIPEKTLTVIAFAALGMVSGAMYALPTLLRWLNER